MIYIPIPRFQPFKFGKPSPHLDACGADFFIDANDEISSIELGEFREALDVSESKINTIGRF